MKKFLKSNSKALPLILVTSKTAPKIESEVIKKGLKAEKVEQTSSLKGSPPALIALHQELYERLRSTGGRQGLEGVSRRQKIPLSEEDWKVLQQLAKQSQNEQVRPSPSQVASVLLHQALKELESKSKSL